MPFRLNAPELSAKSCNGAILTFVKNYYSSRFEEFLDLVGKTEPEILDASNGTHQACLDLEKALHAITDSQDPKQMLDVYAELGKIDNPVTLLAKILGAPMLVFRASAALTQRLNKDSRIKALPTSPTSCLIQHTVLGNMDSMYPSQIFGTVGYFNGMRFTFPLKDFDCRLRLVQMPLVNLLKYYSFLGFNWSTDLNGNLLDNQGNILAESIRFADTPFRTIKPKEDYPYPIFRLMRDLESLLLKEGRFIVGNPVLFGADTPKDAFEEIPLDEIRLLRGVRDFSIKGIQVIDKDVFYGGEHPAPASIYDFSWAVDKMRYRLWNQVSRFFSSLYSSPRLVQKMAEERDLADQKRIETEQRLERMVKDLASRTSREAELSSREDELKEKARGNYHDAAHIFTDFRRTSYGGVVGALGMILNSIPLEQSTSFFDKLHELDPDMLYIHNVREFCDLAELGLNGGISENSLPAPKINFIVNEFRNFIDGLPSQENLNQFLSWWNKFKENCYQHEEKVRNWMTELDAEFFVQVNYKDLWEDIFYQQKDLLGKIRYILEIPSVNVYCSQRKMFLVVENLLLNMVEAARRTSNPSLNISAEVVNGDLETRLQNPAVWASEDQAKYVEEKANLISRDRFSTKEDQNNKGMRGGGLSFIKGEIRSLGGSYRVISDYQKSLFTQIVTLPQEIIKN